MSDELKAILLTLAFLCIIGLILLLVILYPTISVATLMAGGGLVLIISLYKGILNIIKKNE
jgi:hypothetical protein